MPPNCQQAQEAKGGSREMLLAKFDRIGLRTFERLEVILGTSIYIEQNYKSCHGMFILEKKVQKGKDRKRLATGACPNILLNE